MKRLVVLIFMLSVLNLNAQEDFQRATIQIDWRAGYHATVNIDTGDTVQWNFAGFHSVISSGSPSFISSGTQNGGSYSVQFNTPGTYYYFCGVHSATSMDGMIVVSNPLSIDKFNLEDSLSISPNPSTTSFDITFSKYYSESLSLEIYNVLGSKIYVTKITDLITSVDVSSWSNGVYIVKISSNDRSSFAVKRFIKN